MGLWEKVKAVLVGADQGDENAYWVYVRCAKCGESLRARVDLRNDLSLSEEGTGYFTRKTIIGSNRCFSPIEAELFFDANRRLIDRTIQGGDFIQPEEYSEG